MSRKHREQMVVPQELEVEARCPSGVEDCDDCGSDCPKEQPAAKPKPRPNMAYPAFLRRSL